MHKVLRTYLLAVILFLALADTASAALGQTILRYGARGAEVSELQQYLYQLGLLRVQPTGYFGNLTATAVRQFQAESGLAVDGLVGPLTAAALQRAAGNRYHVVQPGESLWLISHRHGTTVDALRAANALTGNLIYPGQRLLLPGRSSTPSRGNLNRSDLDLLARVVYAEAKGEPYLGKVAVAAVVLNRVDSPLFPNTVRGVIYQPYQFEPVQNGSINQGYDAASMNAVLDALAGTDPTYGALYFYNPGKVSHSWMATRQTTTVIGQHVFSR